MDREKIEYELWELARALSLFLLALAAGMLLISPPVLLVTYFTKGWKGWWRHIEIYFIAEMAAAFLIVRSYSRRRKAHYGIR